MPTHRYPPTQPAPLPRRFDPSRDRRELAGVLKVAVNDLHMKVPAQWAHEALGVPMADGREAVLASPEAS